MPFDANNNDTMMQWLAGRLDRIESRGDQNFNVLNGQYNMLNERISTLERNFNNPPPQRNIDVSVWQIIMWMLMIGIAAFGVMLMVYLGGNLGAN